ncbi:ABC transporter substrate-binding protein [Chromobacterium sp. IIBBL 290-4]|uniref:substrate-binding periplasmic protein n=1 Tax=Chromobacterium sp. IIBBL 290-4 TaxID=2953890 RepID=UPI0020B89F2E|nr:transporter substrate-binding domain-containing protein [Chromobacterium sp. IIBBL 290-4]UTH72751.1 transporter substrate-binding domain-containing protein [Chromobacterium sp. IIBBL 290-4]
MMRRFWLACGWLLSGAAWAEAPVLTVDLYTLDYPPFVTKEDGKPPRGIAVDLAMAALSRAGLRGQVVDLPWKRAQMQVMNEPLSCLMPLTRSAKREEQYRWVGMIDNSQQSLFVIKTRPGHLRGLNDLKGLRIVTLLGSSMAEWLRLHNVAFSELPTTEDAYRELSLGVADAWAVHGPVARYLVKKQGSSAVPIREELRLQETSVYFACSKRMPQAVAKSLEEAFQSLRSSGETARIMSHYLD